MANFNQNGLIPPTVTSTPDLNNSRTSTKIQQLYALNSSRLYSGSPYTENSGVLAFGPRQPFVYVFPNDGRKGINGLKRFENRSLPIGSAPQDVVRISKFLATGKGLLFLTKQFSLQRFNPYNETRLYNPLSPIAATVRAGTLYTTGYPQRHIEGGLTGFLTRLIGLSSPRKTPVPGTVAERNDEALPGKTKEYKGLLRSDTSATAYNRMNKLSNNNSIFSRLGGAFGFARKLFSSFNSTVFSQNAKSLVRADEEYLTLNINSKNKFDYFNTFYRFLYYYG